METPELHLTRKKMMDPQLPAEPVRRHPGISVRFEYQAGNSSYRLIQT
jgi:hypothetical protein